MGIQAPKTNSRIFDTELRLKDAGAVAASAAATVGGSAKVLNIGEGEVYGEVIADVTAIEVADGDEVFNIIAQFSTSPTFTGSIVPGPSLRIGVDATNIASADSTVGRYKLPFTNNINGVTYPYMRLYTLVTGTVATGINYSAFADVIRHVGN